MEPDSVSQSDALARYTRQMLFPQVGYEGQRLLSASTALVVGCGALGSVIAETLVRAGVGCVRIVDRDFLELHNLQRQVLFDESDVVAGLPKAIAAQRKLQAINSDIKIEAYVEDLHFKNIEKLAQGATVMVDGTDNFEARFLLNDYSLESNTPWIYGGCVGSEGQSLTIVPGKTNCLNCLMAEGPPPPGSTAGCDVAGILGPVVNVIASIEATEALKILSGNIEAVSTDLTVVDIWAGRFTKMKLGQLADKIQCPACRQGQRNWLSGSQSTSAAVLCGQNSVQIRPKSDGVMDFDGLAAQLASHGQVHQNEYLLKLQIPPYSLTLFLDGRAIISGTDDPAKARSLYSQWIGN